MVSNCDFFFEAATINKSFDFLFFFFFRKSIAEEIDSIIKDTNESTITVDQVSTRMQRLNLYFEKENVNNMEHKIQFVHGVKQIFNLFIFSLVAKS